MKTRKEWLTIEIKHIKDKIKLIDNRPEKAEFKINCDVILNRQIVFKYCPEWDSFKLTLQGDLKRYEKELTELNKKKKA